MQHRVLLVTTLALASVLAGAFPSRWAAPAVAPRPLTDETLVVWARPANLAQEGSGTLSGLEDDAFDSIVLGEVRPGAWMPGSDRFHRTETHQRDWPQQTRGSMTSVVVVYRGTTRRLAEGKHRPINDAGKPPPRGKIGGKTEW